MQAWQGIVGVGISSLAAESPSIEGLLLNDVKSSKQAVNCSQFAKATELRRLKHPIYQSDNTGVKRGQKS